jgi:hypothetical protein
MSDKEQEKNILKVIEEINNILDTEPFDKKKYKKKNIELTQLTNIYIKKYGKQKLHKHSLIKQKWDEIKAKGLIKNQKKTKKNVAGPADNSTLREVSLANASLTAITSVYNSKGPASKGKARAVNPNEYESNKLKMPVITESNRTVTASTVTAIKVRAGKEPVSKGKAPVSKGKAPAVIQNKSNSNSNNSMLQFARRNRNRNNGAGPANNAPVTNPKSNVGYRLVEEKILKKKKKIKLEELNSKLQALLGECSFEVIDEKGNEDFQRDMEILLSENQLDLFIEDSITLLNKAILSGKKRLAIIDGENIMHYTAYRGVLALDLIKSLVKKNYFVFIFRHNKHLAQLVPRSAKEEKSLKKFTFQIGVGEIGSFLDDFCSVLLASLSCSLKGYYGKPTFLTNVNSYKSSKMFSSTLKKTTFLKGVDVSIGSLNTKNAIKLAIINDIKKAPSEFLPNNFIFTLDKFKWCKFKKTKKTKKKKSNEAGPAEE